MGKKGEVLNYLSEEGVDDIMIICGPAGPELRVGVEVGALVEGRVGLNNGVMLKMYENLKEGCRQEKTKS